MSLRHAWYILPLAAVAVALFALLLWRGKGEGQGAVSEEAALEEYYAGLENIRRERLPIAAERAKAVKAMEEIVAQAKNALAAEGVADPSDEALKAEIEGHPEKYPEWKGLHERVSELNRQYSAELRKMQGAVRERMKSAGVQVPGAPAAKQGK